MDSQKLWKVVSDQFDATCPSEIIAQAISNLHPVVPMTDYQLNRCEEQFICSVSHEND